MSIDDLNKCSKMDSIGNNIVKELENNEFVICFPKNVMGILKNKWCSLEEILTRLPKNIL